MPPRVRKPAAPVAGPVLTGVRAAIAELSLKPNDAGAIALALMYAGRIDSAAQLESDVAELADDADELGELYREVTKLGRRADTVAVLNDLGPKLLAVLVELGATPRARGAKPGVKPPGLGADESGEPTSAASTTPDDELARMRARRTP